jgi:hypothetical protein
MVDIGEIVQALLFGLFGALTAALAAIIGPTYDNVVVPELQVGQLFPPLGPGGPGDPVYLSQAAKFSSFTLVTLVDPLIAVVAIGIGGVYLTKAVWSRSAAWADGLIARFVVAVVLANFTVPIAGGILGLAGAMYPTVAGYDGGAWQHWINLAGYGEFSYSWSNGALTFVLVLVQFSLVLLLALAIALRDALLAVLLVLLPLFTIVWPIRPFSTLAKRGWLLFVELAFLPCVLVIPLELAVGSPNVELLVAYLSIALASPFLLSMSGTQLSSFGFPNVGSTVSNGVERGLMQASRGPAAGLQAFSGSGGGGAGSTGSALQGSSRSVAGASMPVAAPILMADALGRGAAHLARHIRGSVETSTRRFAPVARGGGG